MRRKPVNVTGHWALKAVHTLVHRNAHAEVMDDANQEEEQHAVRLMVRVWHPPEAAVGWANDP